MDLKEVYLKRRSVNFFKKDFKVSLSDLKKIYDLAKLAPSSFNLQPYKILIVSKPKYKKLLKEVALNQQKVEDASVVLVILADKEGYKDFDRVFLDMIKKGYSTEDKKEFYKSIINKLYNTKILSRGFALRNAGLFALSFIFSAKYYGFDTHPMDGFEIKKLIKYFNIPTRYEPLMLIALGKFDDSKRLLPRLKRKDFKEIIIKETF
ncbi:MAG: nitroreductase family protein [Candidatus Aenigmatarchaeota archaeon]